ncbi:MAG: V-type ATP synthase subunit D [Candidatus Omnitrophica bacterium]|nr:V-type ATP synthase subunit D [Candidatus Omnitrophota bacterium]
MKVKLTKGELKKQRDALSQYERYLPTLQLKKQQLQLEILQQLSLLTEKKQLETKKKEAISVWAGLLSEEVGGFKAWILPLNVITTEKNVAGVVLPVFEKAEFPEADYDLFDTPLWVDFAIDAFRQLVCLREEIETIEKGIEILRQELRITTQRVNLFEKVKIPDTREAIRLIKIYIGDQLTNAVGRSKIAKRKIEEAVFEGAAA